MISKKQKSKFQNSQACETWREEGALENWGRIVARLPIPAQDKNRTGVLRVAPITDSDGDNTHFWMSPLDNSKIKGILLGPQNHVQLFDRNGSPLFDGYWGDITDDVIIAHEELYVWVERIKPTSGARWAVKKPWWFRVFEFIVRR